MRYTKNLPPAPSKMMIFEVDVWKINPTRVEPVKGVGAFVSRSPIEPDVSFFNVKIQQEDVSLQREEDP